MEPIVIECASCGKKLKVAGSAAGKKVKCPGCETTFRVPAPDALPASSSAAPDPDEPLRFGCPECGGKMKVPAGAVGKRVKCPKCAGVITVPDPHAPADDWGAADSNDDLLNDLAGGIAPAADEPKITLAPLPPMPVEKTKAVSTGGGGTALPKFKLPNVGNLFHHRISRLWVGLVVGGVALIVCGLRELRINAVADAAPQRITCDQLAAQGPGDNAHVIVSDFLMCDAYVYEAGRTGAWNRAWVPVVPLDGEYAQMVRRALESPAAAEAEIPLPTDIRIIVELPHVANERDVQRFGDQEEIQGTIINVVKKLDKETKQLLEENYDVDMDRCWILLEGHVPGDSSRVWNYFGGGGVLAAFGGIMLLRIMYGD